MLDIDITGTWFLSWAPPTGDWIQHAFHPWTEKKWTGRQSSRIPVNFVPARGKCDHYIGHYTDTTPHNVYTYNRAEFRVRKYAYDRVEYVIPQPKGKPLRERNTGPVVSIVYHYKTVEGGVYDKHEAFAGFLRRDKIRGRFMYGFLYGINDNASAVFMMSDRLRWSKIGRGI